MTVLLDGRNVTHYALESLRVVANDDSTQFDVVSDNLAETQNVVASFDSEAKALSFIKKAQDAVIAAENIEYIDLRTPPA